MRVFISSTLEELAAERAAARRAIARLHLVPVYYESGARPHPPRAMYRAYLEQSQVFVDMSHRYGWVAPGMEISGLEDEYRLAAGKPMLLYLRRPARPRTWTGTKPSPTPSPSPARPSANSNPRPRHERTVASTRGYRARECPVMRASDRGGHGS